MNDRRFLTATVVAPVVFCHDVMKGRWRSRNLWKRFGSQFLDRGDVVIRCNNNLDSIADLQHRVEFRVFAEGDQDARAFNGFDDNQFGRQ